MGSSLTPILDRERRRAVSRLLRRLDRQGHSSIYYNWLESELVRAYFGERTLQRLVWLGLRNQAADPLAPGNEEAREQWRDFCRARRLGLLFP